MIGQLSPREIDEVLNENSLGRIGCRDGDRIYIVPISYIYEYGAVICQSYEGLKVSLMRNNPEVCFEVEALDSFFYWKTVIGWGTYEELTDPEDISYARNQLSEVVLAQKARRAQAPPSQESRVHLAQAPDIVYYRIRFREVSGRFEKEF